MRKKVEKEGKRIRRRRVKHWKPEKGGRASAVNVVESIIFYFSVAASSAAAHFNNRQHLSFLLSFSSFFYHTPPRAPLATTPDPLLSSSSSSSSTTQDFSKWNQEFPRNFMKNRLINYSLQVSFMNTNLFLVFATQSTLTCAQMKSIKMRARLGFLGWPGSGRVCRQRETLVLKEASLAVVAERKKESKREKKKRSTWAKERCTRGGRGSLSLSLGLKHRGLQVGGRQVGWLDGWEDRGKARRGWVDDAGVARHILYE